MKPNTGQKSPKTFRPGAEGLKRVLGDLEADIMEFVWSAEERPPAREVSVRDVMDGLGSDRASAYATVKTVMNRLVEKGHLIRRKEDRAYVYRSSSNRAEFWNRVCGAVLQGLMDGSDRGLVLSHLMETVTEEDAENLDRLAALIEAKRRELGRPTGGREQRSCESPRPAGASFGWDRSPDWRGPLRSGRS